MKVFLRNNWFGPDGTLYRSNRSPHSMPEAWRKLLPKSSRVEGEAEAKAAAEGDDSKKSAEDVKAEEAEKKYREELGKLTVAQLQARAKVNNVEIKSDATKDEIINALVAAKK